MNALLLLRSRRAAVPALSVVFLGALSLTALRLDIPGAAPGVELLLFGALGAVSRAPNHQGRIERSRSGRSE